MDNSQIKLDALDFAENFRPQPTRRQDTADYVAAYEEGAKQMFRYMMRFAIRVNKRTPLMADEFSAGQLDGVLWSLDHISTLLGID